MSGKTNLRQSTSSNAESSGMNNEEIVIGWDIYLEVLKNRHGMWEGKIDSISTKRAASTWSAVKADPDPMSVNLPGGKCFEPGRLRSIHQRCRC